MRDRVSKTFRRAVKRAVPLDPDEAEQLAQDLEQLADEIRYAKTVTATQVRDQQLAKGPLISDRFMSWYPHLRRLELSLTLELWPPDRQE
jgi:hypothetical protein